MRLGVRSGTAVGTALLPTITLGPAYELLAEWFLRWRRCLRWLEQRSPTMQYFEHSLSVF